MEDKQSVDGKKALEGRRQFLKKVALGAGLGFVAPVVLSSVRPRDLQAQVTGGMTQIDPPALTLRQASVSPHLL